MTELLQTLACWLVTSTVAEGVELVSKLPKEPIENPASWAWAAHPNGLGYKARNGLSMEQCLAAPPCTLVSPLCKGHVFEAQSFFQCTKNKCWRPTYLCEEYCVTFKTCKEK